MTQQLIITSPANTQTGDSPKAAFDKINANFTEVYNLPQGLAFSGTDTGAVNAYVVSVAGFPAILVAGLTTLFVPGTVNTGPSTVNVGGTGVNNIVNWFGTPLTGGEINGETILRWNGAAWQLVVSACPVGNQRTTTEVTNSVIPVTYRWSPGLAPRYGAVDDNSTDNATAFATITTLANAYVPIYFPKINTAVYLTSVPLHLTAPCILNCDDGVVIKLTAAGSYVMALTSGGGIYEAFVGPFRLDAAGNAPDSLLLDHVFDSTFDRVRAMNSTTAGLHLKLAQSCTFYTPTCAPAIDSMTTVPNNGMLIDTASSADNIFIDPTFWGLTGKVGINAPFALGSIFINGQSEANGIGVIFGQAVGSNAFGNTIIGMDLEANSTADVQLLATSYSNNLIGLESTGAIQITGGQSNHIFGGFVGSITMDAASATNTIRDVTGLAGSATIVDSGSNNLWSGVYNRNTGLYSADKGRRTRVLTTLSTTGSVNIDCSTTKIAEVVFTGAGASTITFNAPTNMLDGYTLYIRLSITGAGAVTLVWGGALSKEAGIVTPANGFNRTTIWTYDANQGAFYLAGQSPADIPN